MDLFDYSHLHQDLNNHLLFDRFINPAYEAVSNYCRCRRECSVISDTDFLNMGVLRTISQCQSGRDFLQHLGEVYDTNIHRASFFGTLHSRRRLGMVGEVGEQVFIRGRQRIISEGKDLLAHFQELQGRAVYAGDGHKIEHACHALKDKKGRHVPPNTVYLLCLRTGMFRNFGPVQGDGSYAHELPVFRRRFLAEAGLRRSKSGAGPIFVLDLAYIDNGFWTTNEAVRLAGAVLISRLKSNMIPKRSKKRVIDRQNPINLGVDEDSIIWLSNNQPMRLILYTDPETHTCYQFLTTDFDLPPGLIAWLYFLRWKIEKTFDTAKNKLEEVKAWATGECARDVQGHFLALTHNLLILFRHFMEREQDAPEKKLQVKREKALKQRQKQSQDNGRTINPLHQTPHFFQLSLQFIRALRNHFMTKSSLGAALPRIRAMLDSYL